MMASWLGVRKERAGCGQRARLHDVSVAVSGQVRRSRFRTCGFAPSKAPRSVRGGVVRHVRRASRCAEMPVRRLCGICRHSGTAWRRKLSALRMDEGDDRESREKGKISQILYALRG